MFNLFKKIEKQPKIDMAAVHTQYKNLQMDPKTYFSKTHQAVCEYFISDDVRKKIENLGINMYTPQEEYTPTCDRQVLLEIASELRRSVSATSLLRTALKEITPNKQYEWPSEKYKGKNIISHKEWCTFYDKVPVHDVSVSYSPEEIYKFFIRVPLLSIELVSHSFVLIYGSLLRGGATIV